MFDFWSVAQRKALLFLLVPGAVCALIGLAVTGLMAEPVTAWLTAFVALVALLLDMGSGMALVNTRPPANRGSALVWGLLLFVVSLLVTWLLLKAFGSARLLR